MKYESIPHRCNICGGNVRLRKRDAVFYYECDRCKATVRTDRNIPNRAVGILANNQTKDLRHKCHLLFDRRWKGKKNELASRRREYAKLAKQLNITLDECHFGLMSKEKLEEAYRIMRT